ncbi:tIGR00255 family protein [Firmicutes bacterium CAG:170]|nr:YicC family protein [Oscillospiraceae bacterium]CDB87305.1 tIGR00255 family protein [Firmicutes bacterium CAG:170]
MIRSMTGYGRAVETIDGREITAELRSVNNRYLDCTVKMPRIYAFAEDSVKTHVKSAISRGKVDVFIAVNVMEDMQMRISVNHPVLEGYLSAMRSIASDYGVRDDISVTALSRLPDVFVVEKAEEDEEKLTQDILSVVDKALEKFTAMRTTEGAALEADLRGRAATILTLVEKVEQRSPVTLAEYRARLTEKMQEVLQSTTIDEGRILQEAAIYADKIAVDEETVRLRSHLNQLETMLTNGGAIGRKLDFLLQELNREANTIGSKGNDLEQARTVVEIKAELEKIREQTQNIE